MPPTVLNYSFRQLLQGMFKPFHRRHHINLVNVSCADVMIVQLHSLCKTSYTRSLTLQLYQCGRMSQVQFKDQNTMRRFHLIDRMEDVPCALQLSRILSDKSYEDCRTGWGRLKKRSIGLDGFENWRSVQNAFSHRAPSFCS